MSDLPDEWTFALIDLAGFTALTESHGDDQAADLATEFADLATRLLGPRDKLIKTIGDAVLLAAEDPQAGLELVRRIIEACYESDGFPEARVGIHHGSAVVRGEEMFGAAINLTARVAAHASGGQVLATTSVAHVARERDIPTVSIGLIELKNVAERVELFEISMLSPPSDGAIDPVCRMRVSRGKAAGSLRHLGVDYLFCSLECASAFSREPERYRVLAR